MIVITPSSYTGIKLGFENKEVNPVATKYKEINQVAICPVLRYKDPLVVGNVREGFIGVNVVVSASFCGIEPSESESTVELCSEGVGSWKNFNKTGSVNLHVETKRRGRSWR